VIKRGHGTGIRGKPRQGVPQTGLQAGANGHDLHKDEDRSEWQLQKEFHRALFPSAPAQPATPTGLMNGTRPSSHNCRLDASNQGRDRTRHTASPSLEGGPGVSAAQKEDLAL